MQPQVVESGVQLFSRMKKSAAEFSLNNMNPKLFQPGAPNAGDIIEITGDFVKDLLLDFLLRCILPKELNPDWRSSGAVFINTTHHINILNITTAIDAHLKELKIVNRRAIVEKALSHITILNCYHEEQIEITLRNLDNIIQDRNNISLVIMDDISSQFWVANHSAPYLSLETYSKNNFQLLQSIIKNLNVILIFSYQFEQKKTVDLPVDYKIVGEEIETKKRFIVMDCVKNTTNRVPFALETFINFI